MEIRFSAWSRPALFCVGVLACVAGLRADDPARADATGGKNTVVWISMDGMRGDYLNRAPLPFFERLMREGAYSRRFHPVFPPITFPSHCAEATGVTVERHGITGNSFYDAATHQTYHYPGDGALLQAEPIWLTAARQGVRTMVLRLAALPGGTRAGPRRVFQRKIRPRSDRRPADGPPAGHVARGQGQRSRCAC